MSGFRANAVLTIRKDAVRHECPRLNDLADSDRENRRASRVAGNTRPTINDIQEYARGYDALDPVL